MFSALQGANLSNTLCSTALHVGSPDHPIMMVVLVMTLSTMYDRKHSTVQIHKHSTSLALGSLV